MNYLNPVVDTHVFITPSIISPTLQDAVEEYLEWKASYSKTAHRTYRLWVERFQQFTGKLPEQLTLQDVTGFLHSIKNQELYAEAYIQYAMNIVHNYLCFFHEQGRLRIPPSLVRVPRAVKNSHHAITEEEYQKILGVLKTSKSLRDICIIRLLHDTGMRVGELCSLDLEDMEEDMSAVIRTEKTVTKRTVFWNADTDVHVQRYLVERVNSHQGGDALFAGADRTERLSSRSMQRVVGKVAEKAGVKNISPHSFRHGFIHRMARLGTPDAIIAQLVGHGTPYTISHYTKLSRPELRQAFRHESFCRLPG